MNDGDLEKQELSAKEELNQQFALQIKNILEKIGRDEEDDPVIEGLYRIKEENKEPYECYIALDSPEGPISQRQSYSLERTGLGDYYFFLDGRAEKRTYRRIVGPSGGIDLETEFKSIEPGEYERIGFILGAIENYEHGQAIPVEVGEIERLAVLRKSGLGEI